MHLVDHLIYLMVIILLPQNKPAAIFLEIWIMVDFMNYYFLIYLLRLNKKICLCHYALFLLLKTRPNILMFIIHTESSTEEWYHWNKTESQRKFYPTAYIWINNVFKRLVQWWRSLKHIKPQPIYDISSDWSSPNQIKTLKWNCWD